jgi:hypothetical protein
MQVNAVRRAWAMPPRSAPGSTLRHSAAWSSGSARMVDDMIVQQLHVARLETHFHADFLRNFGQQVERFPLRIAHLRHCIEFLCRLYIGS